MNRNTCNISEHNNMVHIRMQSKSMRSNGQLIKANTNQSKIYHKMIQLALKNASNIGMQKKNGTLWNIMEIHNKKSINGNSKSCVVFRTLHF